MKKALPYLGVAVFFLLCMVAWELLPPNLFLDKPENVQVVLSPLQYPEIQKSLPAAQKSSPILLTLTPEEYGYLKDVLKPSRKVYFPEKTQELGRINITDGDGTVHEIVCYDSGDGNAWIWSLSGDDYYTVTMSSEDVLAFFAGLWKKRHSEEERTASVPSSPLYFDWGTDEDDTEWAPKIDHIRRLVLRRIEQRGLPSACRETYSGQHSKPVRYRGIFLFPDRLICIDNIYGHPRFTVKVLPLDTPRMAEELIHSAESRIQEQSGVPFAIAETSGQRAGISLLNEDGRTYRHARVSSLILDDDFNNRLDEEWRKNPTIPEEASILREELEKDWKENH